MCADGATGDRLCKYYASGAIVRFACVLCSASSLCKYTPYANRRGLNACSRSRVLCLGRPDPSFILTFAIIDREPPLDECHRSDCHLSCCCTSPRRMCTDRNTVFSFRVENHLTSSKRHIRRALDNQKHMIVKASKSQTLGRVYKERVFNYIIYDKKNRCAYDFFHDIFIIQGNFVSTFAPTSASYFPHTRFH